ncbi:MAG: ABC transporter ATP-binding protein [Candidatus Promineifilaceae bacterium]
MQKQAKKQEPKQSIRENARGVIRLINGYRLLYLGAMIATGIAAVASTYIYLTLAQIIDEILPQEGALALMPRFALILVGLALLQGIFSFGAGRWAAYVAERSVQQLRNYLYDHIQRLSFQFHDRETTGELLQRSTSDVDTIRKLFSEQGVGIGRIIFLFTVSFSALYSINSRLALSAIAIIPVILVTSLIFFRIVGKRFEAYQAQEAKMTNRLQENLAGVRVVKAFARQAFEKDKFAKENNEHYAKGTHFSHAHAMYWPSTDILCGMQTLFAYYVGATMAIEGVISIGEMIAAAALVGQIIWPIRNLGRLLADSSTAIVSFGRINKIIKEAREPLNAGTAQSKGNVRGAVRFENVNFQYAGEKNPTVLHDISFSAEAGSITALLGSTGSGKTTIMNLLPRFYEYIDGHIWLDDVELNSYPRGFLREQIGIVMQEPFLFATTIRENITFSVSRKVTDEELFAAARSADVHDVIMTFPKGYETIVGERGVTLSGGQKQRITLARTILQNPSILILDDATSAVDTETESRIREAMVGPRGEQENTARTTFIIAHRIQSVMHADQILILDKGRIIERGTHQDLLAQDGVYQRIYQLQASIEADLEEEIGDATVEATEPLFA